VTDLLDERTAALRALDTQCPHCGAERAPDQAFCVECGYALPPVRGRLPRWRRRWVSRVGWYPGDWLWPALLALLVALAGAAAAIAVSHARDSEAQGVFTALANIPVRPPAAAPTTAAAVPPPAPTAAPGKQTWPAGQTAWTIVLVSYPKTAGRPAAQQTATRAAQKHLPEVGILDSSRYPSLQPGYFVVFSGIYATQAEANTAVSTAHSAGFGAAYSRQIAG
jgi:hypothetical protein